MTNRTPEEITNIITKLRKEQSLLPEFNYFGDSNKEIYDLMVDVIQNDMSKDQIYDMELDPSLEDSALAAYDWLEGHIRDEELVSVE